MRKDVESPPWGVVPLTLPPSSLFVLVSWASDTLKSQGHLVKAIRVEKESR